MKKIGKKLSTLFFLCLLFAAVLPGLTKQTQAAEQKKVMTFTVKDKYNTVSSAIYAVPYGNDYWFTMEKNNFTAVKEKSTDQVQISVKVDDPNLVVPESLLYEKSVALDAAGNSHKLSFVYRNGADLETFYLYYNVNPITVNLKIESLIVASSSKGFYPSKGNYLPIYSSVLLDTEAASGNTILRLRVNNSKGKYVYQKSFLANGSGRATLNYRWNGKASKNNTAKAKAGAYVKPGTYKVEVCLYYGGNIRNKTVTKTKKLVISKKAPKGTKGVAKAKKVPMLTGYANIDYMAEQMVKEAGVKSGMSQDQKVKKIYHYMTRKFKHVHYGEKAPKSHFNLNKLNTKIAAYRRKTDSDLRKGKLIYTYYAGVSEWNFQRRCGVCDDNAAAFMILCRHVGVDAGVVNGGYKNRNGSVVGHAWNYAVINGKTYYYDVDVEIQNYKGGQGDYYWYKKTKSQAKKNHVF